MRWTWRRNGNCAIRCAGWRRKERAGARYASSGDILPEIERVILMRSGRIVADGAREDLLTEGRLSELFEAPVRIGAMRNGCTAGRKLAFNFRLLDIQVLRAFWRRETGTIEHGTYFFRFTAADEPTALDQGRFAGRGRAGALLSRD